MSKYPNPCDKCDRVHCSNYRTFPEYLKYFRTIWKQIHGYPARHYRNCKKTKS